MVSEPLKKLETTEGKKPLKGAISPARGYLMHTPHVILSRIASLFNLFKFL